MADKGMAAQGMAEKDTWRDPTAAKYYDDDPPYLDALSAPGEAFGTSSYLPPAASVPVPAPAADATAVGEPAVDQMPPQPSPPLRQPPAPPARPPAARPPAARPPAARPPAARPPAPPRSSRSAPPPAGRPPGWARAEPAPAPRRQWLPQAPTPTVPWQKQRSAPPDAPTSFSPPTYTAQTTTFPGPPQSGRSPGFATRTRPGAQGRPWRRNKSGRLGCLPAVIVLVAVLFLGNGGIGAVKRLINRSSVPAGVTNTVTGYYDELAAGAKGAAQVKICSTHLRSWVAGQTKSGSDTRRGVQFSTITGKRKSGSGYDVDVTITTRNPATRALASPTAVLHVIKEGGQYRLCGGTSP